MIEKAYQKLQDYRPSMHALCLQGILLCRKLSNKHSGSVISRFVRLITFKAIADGLVGQVLAGPLYLKVKNKITFYKKQVINKSTRVIFGLAQLVIL